MFLMTFVLATAYCVLCSVYCALARCAVHGARRGPLLQPRWRRVVCIVLFVVCCSPGGARSDRYYEQDTRIFLMVLFLMAFFLMTFFLMVLF